MSLFKPFGILRRFLNTAASNSKPILNGQPEARRTQFYGHSPRLLSVVWMMLELPLYMVMAYPIVSWLNKSKNRARLGEIWTEIDEAMDKKYTGLDREAADEEWHRHLEALCQAKRLAEDLKDTIEKKKREKKSHPKFIKNPYENIGCTCINCCYHD